jgi:hypothetical protein
MTGRPPPQNLQPGYSLPAFDKSAPPPQAAVLAARIDLHSSAGDVVADLFGRGGWVARAAVDRQRRAISLESTPLTRMLAEVVLRPPDVRHLDAAFQGMAASPRRESSLKVSLGDLYATRCATCGRMVVIDDVIWGVPEGADPTTFEVSPAPIARHYRCTVCRDQRGGPESRQGPLDDDDLIRARADVGVDEVRASLRTRFAPVDGAETLVDELLALHTPRQLVGLAAILERIEGDLRAAPVLAALRLAFLHTILPASRLATSQGRTATLRIGGGHVKLPTATTWRERNPWLAFEDGFRIVRGFVQRLEGSAPLQARLGEDLRSLGEGTATAVLALSSPSGLRLLRDELEDGYARASGTPRIRLLLGQPPVRPGLERLGAAYHATAWVLGREASAILPIDALAGPSLRAPWSWQATTIGRALEAAGPAMARDGRVVMLVDGGPEALVATVLGGASAGYRLVSARLAGGDDDAGGVVELLPPGAARPPGPRTRANVALPAVEGGPGDPELVPGPGLFSAPERFDQRPFSTSEAAKTITEVAVETLRARGEPARYERILGEVLVGLDRAGQLRRLAAGSVRPPTLPPSPPPSGRGDEPTGSGDARFSREGRGSGPGGAGSVRDARPSPSLDRAVAAAGTDRPSGTDRSTGTERSSGPGDAADPVERLLALVRDEMSRPSNTKLTEIEPGRWWLADPADVSTAAIPLADRVEWAVFSLLSTAGPLSEAAFYERIATLFNGHDLPDEGLVRACLDSYRSLASTPDRLITQDDLLRRSQEHTDILASLADAGHRLGMRVWLARREHTRRTADGHLLVDRLDRRELGAYLGAVSRPAEVLEEVDCIWYIRGKVALLFEVEWTAMLGEALLHRHRRIPANENLVRFLVVAPERTELIRYKLGRSPLLREALEHGDFHLIKSEHLRRFLAPEHPDLNDLEPLIGLDPVIERSGEQMPLFGG